MLSDREKAVLELERSWWETDRSKEALIGELGLTSESYAEILAALIDDPRALEEEPLLVRRLQRHRERRRRDRGGSGTSAGQVAR
jgi:hypothetical protein